MAAGTYAEEVIVDNSGTSAAPIVFRPAAGATVTVGGGRSHGFTIVGRSYVQVRGFRVVDTTADGISVKSSQSITLADNEVTGSGAPTSTDHSVGIYLESTSGSVLSGNRLHHNSDRGIYLNLSNNNTISGNVSYSNAREYTREASGMHIYRSNGNTIMGNVTYSNEDSGINIYQTSSNNLIVNNLTYNNGDHGIDVSQSTTGNRLIGNTVYKNVTAGLNAEGGATGTVFENNVARRQRHRQPPHAQQHPRGQRLDQRLVDEQRPDVPLQGRRDGDLERRQLHHRGRAAHRHRAGGPGAAGRSEVARAPATATSTWPPGRPRSTRPTPARAGRPRPTSTVWPGSTTRPPRTAAWARGRTTTAAPSSSSPARPPTTRRTPSTTARPPARTRRSTVNVLANDTDADGDILTVTSAGVPGHGSAVINANGTITYTPASGYTGPDQFGYSISDGRGGTDSATVSVTVSSGGGTTNTAPVAGDDSRHHARGHAGHGQRARQRHRR